MGCCNCAAIQIDVCGIVRKAKVARNRDGLRGEGFVELDDANCAVAAANGGAARADSALRSPRLARQPRLHAGSVLTVRRRSVTESARRTATASRSAVLRSSSSLRLLGAGGHRTSSIH
jgi:hypothetical protein